MDKLTSHRYPGYQPAVILLYEEIYLFMELLKTNKEVERNVALTNRLAIVFWCSLLISSGSKKFYFYAKISLN